MQLRERFRLLHGFEEQIDAATGLVLCNKVWSLFGVELLITMAKDRASREAKLRLPMTHADRPANAGDGWSTGFMIDRLPRTTFLGRVAVSASGLDI